MVPAAIAAICSRSEPRLLYISTDSVFDGGRGNYSETDTPGPVNAYAKTKLHGEREVLRQNPTALIARVNFYGWNAQEKHSLAEWLLQQFTLGKLVPGFSDVFFVRCWPTIWRKSYSRCWTRIWPASTTQSGLNPSASSSLPGELLWRLVFPRAGCCHALGRCKT